MNIIWIVTIVVLTLFLVLFLVRVFRKKGVFGDMTDAIAQQAFNFKEFLKMAFPAAVIYALLYVVFIVLCRFEVFGPIEEMNASTWVPSLLTLYVSIWLLLHIIDMDCRSRNAPFAYFLRTINTNTGVHTWNFVLLAFSAVILILSLIMIASSQLHYICWPLFLAITVSVLINVFVGGDADWIVKSPAQFSWDSSTVDDPEKVKIKAAGQGDPEGDKATPANPNGKTPVERRFRWNLDEKWGIKAEPADDVKVTLFKEDWEAPDFHMRSKNPFFGVDIEGEKKWLKAVEDRPGAASVVLKGPDENGENSEDVALKAIVRNAIELANKYNLADYEVPELLLTFVQYGIKYKFDEDCSPINQFVATDENGKKHLEYFRFGAETIYDLVGDCDCKAVLACRLMRTLGVDAKLIGICQEGESSPSHAAIIFKDDYNRYAECAKFPGYTYCEATGEGWTIGRIPDGLDEESIVVLA